MENKEQGQSGMGERDDMRNRQGGPEKKDQGGRDAEKKPMQSENPQQGQQDRGQKEQEGERKRA